MQEEQQLWRAVILQTFEDLANGKPLQQAQANAWFSASFGTTFADFCQVCDNAGYEPDTVKKAYAIFVERADKKQAFRELRRMLAEGDE